jgi:hypothetical protein
MHNPFSKKEARWTHAGVWAGLGHDDALMTQHYLMPGILVFQFVHYVIPMRLPIIRQLPHDKVKRDILIGHEAPQLHVLRPLAAHPRPPVRDAAVPVYRRFPAPQNT